MEDKEKAGKVDEAEAEDDQKFMNYLSSLYIELKNSSINVEIATNLIDKIKSLQYNADGVKVYFKNE